MSGSIEAQIERVAPGFRDCISARHVLRSSDLEARNANLIGSDINGGAADLWQLLARPVLSPAPYRTPMKGVYLCSLGQPKMSRVCYQTGLSTESGLEVERLLRFV